MGEDPVITLYDLKMYSVKLPIPIKNKAPGGAVLFKKWN